ncbi:MAG: phosphoribosylformylglycinamidine cyclo-ligase [Myxococcota bacterium]|nr:phosphoribosylformylglycinamidine cyclo-ligase [Myxococcota bacterium]
MSDTKPDAYRDAGVNIEAGDAVVSGIKGAVRSTFRPGVLSDIGGFGGLFSLQGRYKDPVLVSGTDGVGTKLLIAQRHDDHSTIGIDLVAMCVNDIVTSGAEPLFFLDYFATGKLAPDVAIQIVEGIAEGCRQSGCALIGGETAEMPGMYAPGHYDLAGFCVGAVERDEIIDGAAIQAGYALIGIPSSGVHSNGYSLVRKLTDDLDASMEHGLGAPLSEVLLRPTRIYVSECRTLIADFDVAGLVHITGGGLLENIPRILPDGLGVTMQRDAWSRPPIFDLLQGLGGLSAHEMNRTFNVGLGMIAIVPAEQAAAAAAAVGGSVVGQVVATDGDRVVVS